MLLNCTYILLELINLFVASSNKKKIIIIITMIISSKFFNITKQELNAQLSFLWCAKLSRAGIGSGGSHPSHVTYTPAQKNSCSFVFKYLQLLFV